MVECLKCIPSTYESLGLIFDTPILTHGLFIQCPNNVPKMNLESPFNSQQDAIKF